MSRWMVVEAILITCCQECIREVFWAAVVPPLHLEGFLSTIQQAVGLCWWLYTMVAVLPSPLNNVDVAESLNDSLQSHWLTAESLNDVAGLNFHLKCVREWCVFSGMRLNAKMATVIVSRSRTMHPMSPPLTLGGTVMKESVDLDILHVIFDAKMTFENHRRSLSRAAFQRLGGLRRYWRVFHDHSLLLRYFRDFVLSVLEYRGQIFVQS